MVFGFFFFQAEDGIRDLTVTGVLLFRSLSTSGWLTISSPVRPSPVTTLSTPAGRPASCASSARQRAVSGVNSAGLTTTVFPAASAGPTFHATINRGEVQGTICPPTPTGSQPANSDWASWAQPA